MKALNPQLSQVPDVRSLIFKSGWRERGEKKPQQSQKYDYNIFSSFRHTNEAFFSLGAGGGGKSVNPAIKIKNEHVREKTQPSAFLSYPETKRH